MGNRIGPNMEPCSTPHVIDAEEEDTLSILIDADLSWR